MGRQKRGIFQLAVIATLPVVLVSFCGNNGWHQKEAAARIVKMEECLACHSGVGGNTVTICTGQNCLYSKTHSLMKPYPPAGREMEYAPLSDILAAGCVLEDGKTTCLSCHDLTKPPPRLIRQGDLLCRICHLNA